MLYKYLRNILFCFPAESIHRFSLNFIKIIPKNIFLNIPDMPIQLFGLKFKNPIGLSAGFDKNGDYIDALAKLGFGFIEVGTVTPKPQSGNPKPRLFRLPEKKALINRLGFNSKGIDYLIERLKKKKSTVIVGVNIGKNLDTPLERSVDDYLFCLEKIYEYADYITINISSPNTPHLRELQQSRYLDQLLSALSNMRSILQKKKSVYRPLLLKISPDESKETLKNIINITVRYKIDGIIATNTTTNKTKIHDLPNSHEAGGLSGMPLLEYANQTFKTLKYFLDEVEQKIPLIGVGGIMSLQDAKEKMRLGAQLIQVYTGLIYFGPYWVKYLVSGLKNSDED